MSDKKSFVLYNDFGETLDKLSNEQAGILFKAIFEWQQTGQYSCLDLTLDLVITPIITGFKRDQAKWSKICASRSSAGKKGGLAKQANARIAKQNKQSLANLADSVSDTVSVTDSEKEKNSFASVCSDFVQKFNEATGKNHRKLCPKGTGQLKARLKDGYSTDDILTAAKNAAASKHHKESGLRHLTPELITRGDKLEAWLNSENNNTPDQIPTDQRPAAGFLASSKRVVGGEMKEVNAKGQTVIEYKEFWAAKRAGEAK